MWNKTLIAAGTALIAGSFLAGCTSVGTPAETSAPPPPSQTASTAPTQTHAPAPAPAVQSQAPVSTQPPARRITPVENCYFDAYQNVWVYSDGGYCWNTGENPFNSGPKGHSTQGGPICGNGRAADIRWYTPTGQYRAYCAG